MLGVFVASVGLIANQWSVDEARAWQAKQHWGSGCNFLPSSAINQLEMWQADSFDLVTIDREMGWMHDVGMRYARVYLHDLAYEQDPKGFTKRMKQFLEVAEKHEIRVMFVFFDDCWNPLPKIGAQPQPLKGVHNSGWVRSPSDAQRNWPADLPRLKPYVQHVLKTFKNDPRVWIWDLYNEPNNSGYGEKSLPLLNLVFEWAREIRPSQPLTAAAWQGGGGLDKQMLALSDVVTFHAYEGPEHLKKQIGMCRETQRPVICSEWMARTNGSKIETNLRVFWDENVSCVQWGFVSGKSNTIFPWGSKEGSEEPSIWFHDLLRQDGTPFDPAEVALYKKFASKTRR